MVKMSRSSKPVKLLVPEPSFEEEKEFVSTSVLVASTKAPYKYEITGSFTSNLFKDDYFEEKNGVKGYVVYFKPSPASLVELKRIFGEVTSQTESIDYEMKPFLSKNDTLRLKLKFEDDVLKKIDTNDNEKALIPKGLSARIALFTHVYFNNGALFKGMFFELESIHFK